MPLPCRINHEMEILPWSWDAGINKIWHLHRTPFKWPLHWDTNDLFWSVFLTLCFIFDMLDQALKWYTKVSSAVLFPHLKSGQGALLCLEDVQAADRGQCDCMCLSKRSRFTFPLIWFRSCHGFKFLLQHSFASKCHLPLSSSSFFLVSLFDFSSVPSSLSLEPGWKETESCVL